MFIPYKLKMLKWRMFRRSDGDRFLKNKYKNLWGKDFDPSNIKTFSDKIFERMISINGHGNEVFSTLADKYLVREYVKQKIGEEYLVNLIWHGTNPNTIPFDILPRKYVIKTNHGSGGNILVDGNIDIEKTTKTLSRWLTENFYWVSREYHYYKINPRILIEEYIDDSQQFGPLDYRFWCFNGVPTIIQVDNYKHNINPFYDTAWNKLDVSYREDFINVDIDKPTNLDAMLLIASALSSDFDFVRVDLYNANGKILFGELTFTPVAGQFKFKPESFDLKLGEIWKQ